MFCHKVTPLILTVLLCTLLALPTVHARSLEFQDRDQEIMIDERFDVSPGDQLMVKVSDANLEVVPGSSNEAHVEVVLEGRDMDRARDYFKRLHFNVYQDGNTIWVETDPERNTFRMSFRDWKDHPRIYVNVSMPENFSGDLRTSDGDIFVKRIIGDIQLRSSDGDIELGAAQSDYINIRTSDGDIRSQSLQSDDIRVETSDGNITFEKVQAAELYARTSDGDIHLTSLDSDAEVRTSDGSIHIDAFLGTRLAARTSDGDIDLELGTTQFDAIKVTTSDGNISLLAPASISADLYLRGESVRLASAFDFEGRLKKNDAQGEINGGGALLEARTSDGRVTLSAK